ncbi:MAG: DUF1588 domain-containing protein [Myxococcota bacterium]
MRSIIERRTHRAGGARRWAERGVGLCIAGSLAGCYTGAEFAADGDPGVPEGSTSESGDEGGSTGDPPFSCETPSMGFVGYRRLTRAQYDNAIRDLLGFDDAPADAFTPDEKIGPFTSNSVSPVGTLQLEQYMRAAEELATRAVQEDLDGRLGCAVPDAGQGWPESSTCLDDFIRDFGSRVYRRPLDQDERERYRLMYQGAAQTTDDPRDGLRVVIQGMLQSPFFLYHVEQGQPAEADGEIVALTDYEVASRLSFLLWNTIPDDELRSSAEAGALGTADAVEQQVVRMLEDPRAREGIAGFHEQWLEIEDLASTGKHPDVFPQYDEALAAAMLEETVEFAYRTLTEGDGRLEMLLRGSHTYTEDPALLALYGAELPADHTPGEPIALDPSQRGGLLTHASVLASHAHTDQTSPVHRGVFVRQNLLCHILPSPPPDVDDTPPDPDPNATTRERFAEHTEDPTCAACHDLIDPIGFAFEHYDGIGAYRTQENGTEIDASGELVATEDIDGPFVGVHELSERLLGSAQVQQCVSRQWFRFAFGRVESDADQCSLETVDEAFVASGYHVPTLIGALVRSDAFRLRRVQGSLGGE